MAITDLSLEDVMRLPLDPQKLAAIGLLTPPAQPAAPAVTVAPMTRPQVGPPTMGETEAGVRPKIPSWQPIATGAPPAMQPLEALPPTAAATPGETLSGIRPMAPVRPTEKASVAAGTIEHGTTPGEEGKRQFGELRPTVTAPPGSAEFWQQTVAQQEFDRAHPWGADISAHPGTLGKIGHVLGRIGNVAGNIVAPGTMALIPGTEMNKAEHRATAEQELGKAETRESEGKLREAQTERERAQTEAIEHPEPKPKEEKWTVVKDFSGPNGEPLEVEENSGLFRLAGSDIHGVKKTTDETKTPVGADGVTQHQKELETLTTGMAPEDKAKFLDAYKVGADDTHAVATKRLEDAKASAQLTGSERDRKLQRDATATNRGEVQEERRSVQDERAYEHHRDRLDKLRQPIADRAERFSRLADTMAQGTPQADALVAPELLSIMAGGQASGLRMNEAEIARIVGGRTNWETLRAKIDAWQLNPNKGFVLTPPQRNQVRELMNSVGARLQKKMDVIDKASDQLINAKDAGEYRKIYADTQKNLTGIDRQALSGEGAGKNSTFKEF